MTIHSDLLAALIFLAFGVVAITIGYGYGFGSLGALGSGAMPMLVGAGLCITGVAQLLQTAAARRTGQQFVSAFPTRELRPLLLILVALLAFGLLIDRLGLLPALAALVGISWFADTGGRKREMLAVLVCVVALIVAIFQFGLGIPFRLVTWRF
ncbi:tripartite tricarboxylate transporter TctB family protein [Devosia ginsengisoli]|uniref:tripartite tricarboxylate transporter TctB family protein n=1 Tax=Devosia ginsengisoli TaxID=400770 RepID=UPI001644D14A|nr:tripartite tricarboxylate transporter TctB family protein [Devosia ginsengisoli]